MTDQERNVLANEIASAILGAPKPSACACDAHAPTGTGGSGDWNGLAGSIDCSLERPGSSKSEVLEFIAATRSAMFRSLCVPPRWTALTVRALKDHPAKVASFVGHPDGVALTPAKCAEAECLLRLGADELWMVADLGGIRSGDLDAAFVDIRSVADLAGCRGARLNVILELPLLDRQQRVAACVVAKLAGAAGAASASGREGSVADTSDIALMRNTVGGEIDILAAGGISTATDARRMLQAGADRVLASHVPAG